MASMKEFLKNTLKRFNESYFKWRYIANPAPSLQYMLQGEKPQGEAKRVLDDLNRDGIAVTSFDKLLDNPALYQELYKEVMKLEDTHKAEIEKHRDIVNVKGTKNFIFPFLQTHTFDANGIFERLCMDKNNVAVANGYFGLLTRLRFFDVWHTLKTEIEATRSQLWHRDPEDRQILKVFVYLSDVDEGAGPFTYARGTHMKGRYRKQPKTFKESGASAQRSTDEDMAEVCPREEWLTATGKAGTIIFADTRGYHKGGHCRTADRLLFNFMFTSPASKFEYTFKRVNSIPGKFKYLIK